MSITSSLRALQGSTPVEAVFMKSFKSHFRIWNLSEFKTYPIRAAAASQRKLSVAKSSSHLLSALFPLPPHDAHQNKNNNLYIAGPLPCWASSRYPHAADCIMTLRFPPNTRNIKSFKWAAKAPNVVVSGRGASTGPSLHSFLSVSFPELIASPRLVQVHRPPFGEGTNGGG